jgi:hypothetical protein
MRVDTMLTREYRGGFIHSRCIDGKEVVTYSLPHDKFKPLSAKTWRSAQLAITRSLKS